MSTYSSAPASTSQVLATLIRTEINRGRWRSGEPLRQEDLAAEYKVSRIPIREALAQLHAEGLVCMEPNRGARVVALTTKDIHEIFDLRVLLEGEALVAALPNHTERTLRDLARWQDDLEVETEPAAWIATDRIFHEGLYAPCGRPRLLGLIGQLRAPVERYGLALLTPGTRREGWGDEHRALLKDIADRDVKAAVNHLRLHLRETEAAIINALDANL